MEAQPLSSGLAGLCRCDCGNSVIVRRDSLLTGNTETCGCAQKPHGMALTSIHSVWATMLARCSNPNNEAFIYYGARGISVCERWKSFKLFYEDMGEKPEGHQIDRIDVNGNYEKSNCRWVLPIENSNNKRNNRRMILNGKTQTMAQWSRELGIKVTTIGERLKRGWTDEKALSTPVNSGCYPNQKNNAYKSAT